MSMNIGGTPYDQNFYDMVKKDDKIPVAKAEVLEEKDKNLINETAATDKINNISKANEEKLSEKAQEFLKNLRKQYGDFDFFIGNSTDDLKALAKSGSKEFSVIFSSAEIERMANDEKYAKEKMQSVEGAVRMSKKINEEYGFLSAFGKKENQNGTINKISIVVNDDGSMKIFAELEKTSNKQRERIEKAREKRAEEKKTDRKNPYEKDDKDSIKRTTIEAASVEELIEKLRNLNWDNVAEAHSGDRFNFQA